MNRSYMKYISKCILKNRGRLFAVFAIIFLGVGFYSGLKATKPSMIHSAETYLDDSKVYDYQVYSTIGFSEDEIDEFKENTKIKAVSGGYDLDVLSSFDENEMVLRAHLLDEDVNSVYLLDGKLPEKGNECVVDGEYFSDFGDVIGKNIVIVDNNEEDTKDIFQYDEYTITGIVYSPLYLNHQKGNTGIGNGKLNSFFYVNKEGMDFTYFNVAYVRMADVYELFDGSADQNLEDDAETMSDIVLDIVESRYTDMTTELLDQKKELEDILSQIESIDEIMLDPNIYPNGKEDPQYLEIVGIVSQKDEVVSGIDEINSILDDQSLEVYVMNRSENLGYSSFENDIDIIDGIAGIFPIFFLLIAMLICATTMTRLIKEERTEIGALYSIGYSKVDIYVKYSIYALIPSFLGASIGFFCGNIAFPQVIWQAYKMMYCLPAFDSYLKFSLLAISFAFSLAASLIITIFVLQKTLKNSPASLLTVEAPIAGKKILLEKMPHIWRHIKFSHKITIRNIFRYKTRVIMTIIGVAGCTMLVVTGLGIKDSIVNIASDQFGEIQLYDLYALYSKGLEAADVEKLMDHTNSYITLFQSTADMKISNDAYKAINLMVSDEKAYSDYFALHNSEESFSLPDKGYVIIDEKTSQNADVKVGDELEIKITEGNTASLKVSGIVQNYVYHYIHMSAETYEAYFEKKYEPNMIFIKNDTGMDDETLSEEIKNDTEISHVGIMEDTKESVEDVMKSLNFVVYVVIFCGGLLALVVLLNLGNINISEREREIATVKILGFYRRETLNYVFRENMILTIIGIILGLPTGKLLHEFIMEQLNIDIVTFKSQIFGTSFIISVGIVFVFSLFVNLLLRRKIVEINMIEALKCNE